MARMNTAMLEEWWGECGFDEMKLVTGFSYYEFNPEDGYQEYVDYCDEIWDNMTYREKLSAYKNVEGK